MYAEIKRLEEIEAALNSTTSEIGMTYEELADDLIGKPIHILEKCLELIKEKLNLQRRVFILQQGGDPSNVIFLNSRRGATRL